MAYGLETHREDLLNLVSDISPQQITASQARLQQEQILQQNRWAEGAIRDAYKSTLSQIESNPMFTTLQKQVLSSELQKQAMDQLSNVKSTQMQSSMKQGRWQMEYGAQVLNDYRYAPRYGYGSDPSYAVKKPKKEKPKPPRVPSSFERGVKCGIPVLAIIILAMRLFG